MATTGSRDMIKDQEINMAIKTWQCAPLSSHKPQERSQSPSHHPRLSHPKLVTALYTQTTTRRAMSISVRLTALLLALLSVAPTLQVQAHGFLKTPRSRNYVANQQGMEYNLHSLSRKTSQETCGRTPDRNYNNWSSGIVNTYSCGQQIDVEVEIRAHHKGHFELKACPISPGQTASQACFDSNRLTFVSGPRSGDANYPHRAYFPPWTGTVYPGPPINYWFKFQLPQRLSGDLVLLQWHYVTSNSCAPPGYNANTYPDQTLTQCPNPLPSEILLPLSDPGPAPEQVSNLILHTYRSQQSLHPCV
jgi:hypothetical protein